MVEQFLLTQHKADILEIINDQDEQKHYSVNINFIDLFDNDTELGSSVIKNPEQAFCDLENEIFNVQELLIPQQSQKCSLKINTHARIYGLPLCPELHRTKFPRNADTELFLQFCGTVIRITSSKMLEHQRPYSCTKCKHTEMVEADYDFSYAITPPKKCSKCGNSKLTTGELKPENCKDYQEIKIQEKGNMPSVLCVTLEDDLVDACKPGDDVIICGFVKVRHGPLIVGKKINGEIVLKANHIIATTGYTSPKLITPDIKDKFYTFWNKYKDRPIEGRDVILKSFCPKLYGMYTIKLAVAVVLAGGSRCKEGNEMGIQIRSEPHLLLIGDPGTGKSQILRYAAKVVPRAVLTTGVGTTSAGLTAAAMMEDGHWQLEGGALVLADGGVCCIDEFNSMKPHDRASIHEAMEQQTISIAKVGRVCKLQTRCTILAATNPKGGRLDPSQPLSLNLTLPSPLLSRFDVVMMLRDNYNEEWDNLIADHILNGKGLEELTIGDVVWDLETLQHYFIFIKEIHPVLTTVANKILGSYYQAQRRAETRNKARSTVRLLDSLIRLSQAHARLMCHTEVQVMDALYAVFLIESSMDGECSILLDKINVTAPFVSDSKENYKLIATSILQKLRLTEILNYELGNINGRYEQHEPYAKFVPVETFDLTITDNTIYSIEDIEESEGRRANEKCASLISLENKNSEALNSQGHNDEPESRQGNENGTHSSNSMDYKNCKRHKCEAENPVNSHGNTEEPEYRQANEKGTNSSINVDDKYSKRRKFIKENYQFNKRPKMHKQTKPKKEEQPELNDLQMLNLIPSAIDDFDINILNDIEEDISNTSKNNMNNTEIQREKNNVDDNKFHNVNQSKDSTNTPSNTNQNNCDISSSVQKSESKSKCNAGVELSSATEKKSAKSILSSFRFKRRNPTDETVTSTLINTVQPSNASDNLSETTVILENNTSKVDILKSSVIEVGNSSSCSNENEIKKGDTSQSLFETSYTNYDFLDI